jgi:DmsE family decaheme c-type cytochrome
MFGLPVLSTRRQFPRARPSWTRTAGLVGAAMMLAIVGRAQENTGAPASPPPQNKPAEFVGSTTCQMCHEDIFNAFKNNPHHVVETDKKRGFENNACESCHGPGSKHIESLSAADIKQPAKLKPAETDRICLTCHRNQSTQSGRINSGHARNQVSCTACHTIGPHGLVARKPAEVNALCASCHTDVWAAFQKPYRHRLAEGAMSCVDCHNPHGSALPKQIRTTRFNEPGCAKCHGDKVGPFPFEHAPLRLEGCMTCHQPHGSANPRMLIRHEVRFVCMECHSNLPVPNPAANATLGTVGPAIHDLRSPRFQNCTLCHQKVHGSYADRALTK